MTALSCRPVSRCTGRQRNRSFVHRSRPLCYNSAVSGINSFNNNVERYEAWFTENPFAYVSELHAVRALLPQGSGLEIGVGTGRFAAPLGIRKGIEPSRPAGK